MAHRSLPMLSHAALGLALALAAAGPARAGSNWTAIAVAGDSHSCALNSVGFVYCWGNNDVGQLGNPFVPTGYHSVGPGGANSSVPVRVQGLPGPATAIAVGGSWGVSCALLVSGAVYCWGSNYYGQLANRSAATEVDNAPLPNNVPMPVQGLPAAATSIAVGTEYACASLATGSVACWGTNVFADELGNASIPIGATVLPTLVPGVARATGVSTNWRSTCALTRSLLAFKGHPWPVGPVCWGIDNGGMDGQPWQAQNILATENKSVPWDLTSIAVGGAVVCAMSQSQGILCWGVDRPFQSLGDNFACANASYPGAGGGYCYLPQQLQFGSSPGTGPIMVSAGYSTQCAVYANGAWGPGSVYCWGENYYGQAGAPPHQPDALGTAAAVPVHGNATAVASGGIHSCAIVDSGSNIQCWGYNNQGQLGNGTFTSSWMPVTVH